MRKYFLLIVSTLSFSFGFSQSQKIVMYDVDRFWIAFDSVKVQTNKEKKIDIMKRLYFDKGTEGLKAFVEERHASPEILVDLIEKLPNYWETLRPRMTLLKLKKQELENQILNFKRIYPDLKDSKIYFLIGRINSGGTTQKDKVLIGTEIALGDKSVSTSDFEDNWL
jgi:transposase